MHVLAARVLRRPADFEAAVAFYERTMGLTRFREWGAAPARGVVFFLGGGYLELTESDVPDPAPQGLRLWLQVASAQDARDQLAAHGVTIRAEPERKPWGLIEMEIEDPEGLRIVIVETPPDHPLRRRPD